MSNYKSDIGQAIREEMKKRKVTTRGLASLIGDMSHPQISKVLTGKNYTIDTLFKILNKLDLTITITEKTK